MSVIGSVAGDAAAAVAKPFLPWMILGAVLFVFALTGGAYYEGWSMRGDREAAKQLVAQQKWAADMEKERQRGDKLAVALEAEKQNIKTVTVEVVKEIPKVTKVYVERKGENPKPIPDSIYTNGFVSLWNRSLGSGVPGGPGVSADPSSGSGLLRASIDSSDILTNQAVNAGQYAECRAQLNKLIDWEKGKSKN